MESKITQKNYEAIAIYRQKEKLFELKGKIQSLETENTQLKELLKECAELMGDGTTYMHIDVYQRRKKDVMNAISQVLGEE